MTPEEIAVSFAEAISSQNVDRLSELMTDDHVFMDSDGTHVRGRQKMCEGWREFFAMVPDFKVSVEKKLSQGNTVVFIGRSEGTIIQDGALRPENHWSVPAAWRVAVDGDRVAVWQVYVDPESMMKIYNRIHGK